MFVLNGKVLQPGKPFKHQGFQYPGNWLEQSTASQRRKLGIVERGTPKRFSKNYNPKFYYSAGNPRPVAEVFEALIAEIKRQAGAGLSPTDWYVIRSAETGKPVPAPVSDFRKSVRDWVSATEAELLECKATEELEAAWAAARACPVWDPSLGPMAEELDV